MFLLLILYVTMVLVRPHEYLPSIADASVLPVLLVACVLVWLLRGRVALQTAQHKLLLALLVTMALSQIAAGWAGGAILVFNRFYPTVLLFFLIVGIVDSAARLRAFMLVIVTSVVVMAAHGIGQAATGVGWTGATPIQGRITYIGIFNDPNDLGLVFVVAIPMMVYFLFATKRLVFRLPLLAGLLSVLYGLYLTNSRGAVLGLAALGLLYFHKRYGTFKALLLALALSPIAILAPSRVAEISAEEESAAGRVEAWYAGIDMLRANPVLGVGTGNFVEHHNLTAHNSFVLVFAELGTVGYYIWFSFVALSILMAYRVYRAEAPPLSDATLDAAAWPAQKALAGVLLYSILGFLATAFFLSRSYNILLYILCALAATHYVNVRARWPGFAAVEFSALKGRLFLLSMSSIVLFYLLVKVLLRNS